MPTPAVLASAAGSPPALLAQDDDGASNNVLATIEESIDAVFDPLAAALSSLVFAEVPLGNTSFPWIVAWLVIGGLVFTVYFRGVQFRKSWLGFKIARGRYTADDEPGEISHFQALTAALSGTVGLGSIAGVGLAVTIGGPGATFWMVAAGFLGMASKFVECTLGVRYREYHADGTVSGGPMHYLRKGIAERFPNAFGVHLGKTLAVLSSIFILLFGIAGGNMFQVNQTFAQFENVSGGADGPLGGDGAALIFGIVVAVLIGWALTGGAKTLGAVSSKLIPAMAAIFIGGCFVVLAVNVTAIPMAFVMIWEGAFTGAGVAGGAIGALIVGFPRGACSNEAGLGSAPIAHSAVKTKRPVTEGYVSLLEPFIDTVVINLIAALTIIVANTAFWNEARATVAAGGDTPDGVVVASESFATVLPWFPLVLAVAVALFAITTALTWGYYGMKAWNHLFGRSAVVTRLYIAIYSFFVVVGAVLTFDAVIDFVDSVLFLLAFVNILGLYVLCPMVKEEVERFARDVESGEVVEMDPAERRRLAAQSAGTGPGDETAQS